MIKLLLVWLINSTAIYATAALLPGITIKNFKSALIAAIVLGLLNSILKPILSFFSFPLIIISLGLFSLVINGLMLWISAGLLDGFEVRGFWTAILGAIIISIFSGMMSWIINIR
ncbi:MAG: phage holin family protein [Bacteroidetes bacterium]|nr:phage holin family protein [Bacteroidota bacterium]